MKWTQTTKKQSKCSWNTTYMKTRFRDDCRAVNNSVSLKQEALTVVSSSCRTWSYSLIATQKMIAVTSSKQWIHFFRSDRWPPTSNNLQSCTSSVQLQQQWLQQLLYVMCKLMEAGWGVEPPCWIFDSCAHKFHRLSSSRCGDMANWRFTDFQYCSGRLYWILKILFLKYTYNSELNFASTGEISSQYPNLLPRYSDLSIFQMEDVCHVKFEKC